MLLETFFCNASGKEAGAEVSNGLDKDLELWLAVMCSLLAMVILLLLAVADMIAEHAKAVVQ